MVEEEEKESYLKSLRPSQKYPKSGETESETSKPYNILYPTTLTQRKLASNKCIVYTLFVIVLLSIGFLIFGLAVLRISAPSIRLSSVTIKNLHHSSSPQVASLNMTVVVEIRVHNKIFGPFKFGDENTGCLYGNTTIGVASISIDGGRISSRKHEGINVTMDMIEGDFVRSNANFSKDFDSGLLELIGFTELKGEIQVMKIANRSRTAVMNCSIDWNLKSQAVQDLLCSSP